jgi:hypothetical protein
VWRSGLDRKRPPRRARETPGNGARARPGWRRVIRGAAWAGLVAPLATAAVAGWFLLGGPRSPPCVPGHEAEAIDACESAAIDAELRSVVSSEVVPVALAGVVLCGLLCWWGRRPHPLS